jgi:dihydroxyacid dehydratase/phosphogluconate dehydratase
VAPIASSNSAILSGTVTHVRDGDTIEVNGIAVRLSALDCPEKLAHDKASKRQRSPSNLKAHKLCVNLQVQSPTIDLLVTALLVVLTLDST